MNLQEFRLEASAIQLPRKVKLERLTPKTEGGGWWGRRGAHKAGRKRSFKNNNSMSSEVTQLICSAVLVFSWARSPPLYVSAFLADVLHCMLDCIGASGLAECVSACVFSPEPFVRQRPCLVPRSICLSFIGSSLICVTVTCKDTLADGFLTATLPPQYTFIALHLPVRCCFYLPASLTCNFSFFLVPLV